MNRRLTLTGKTANEVYFISYPKNLLIFLKYDFTIFMERSIDLCRLYMKTGDYRTEEVMEIRNSIISCHKYVEQNIRGVFEKLVIDCWIEYICRQNEIGVVTLWNNFIPCRNNFEKAVFRRLCEYRHNYAINQWVNLLKIQEYALCKVDFVFGFTGKTAQAAAARTNYFDLMFNVSANELGFDISLIAENKIYNMGRTPNSPFVMRNVSREIIRNVLSDIKYMEDNKFRAKKGEFISDQTAMDAFSVIKTYIPAEDDSIVGTMVKSMNEVPQKVYVPSGLKAVIDLEIDVLIESGAVLQRCHRCREYFMRESDYEHNYCDRISREGRSCLDIMSEKEKLEGNVKPGVKKITDSSAIGVRCDQLYKEMSARVNVDITQRDFADWYKYLILIRENVINGIATMEDFENFVVYSHSINFNSAKTLNQDNPRENTRESVIKASAAKKGVKQNIPVDFTPDFEEEEQYERFGRQETKQTEQSPAETFTDSRGREVKPFVFERVDRNAIDEQEPQANQSQALQRKRSLERSAEFTSAVPPVQVSSKIIRGAVPPNIPAGFSPVNMYNDVSFQPGVTIPYGIEPNQFQPQVQYDDVNEKPRNADVKPNTTQSVINNNTINEDEDDDVKIYNIDIVKVFEPNSSRKIKKQTNIEPREKLPVIENQPPRQTQQIRRPQSKPVQQQAERERLLNQNEDQDDNYSNIYTDSIKEKPVVPPQIQEPKQIDSKKLHIVSAYQQTGVPAPSSNVPAQTKTPRIVPNVPSFNEMKTKFGFQTDSGRAKNIDNPKNSPNVYNIREEMNETDFELNNEYINNDIEPLINPVRAKINEPALKIEQTQELDFKNDVAFDAILKGIERSDGFDDDKIPTDADGVPISHKTKRVMDAIFKPSKPSMFLNVNKKDE